MFLLKPTNFTAFAQKALPWLVSTCFLCFLIGVCLALFFSP
ncbi:MAG TPA: ABC transporter permease, partial [Wolbachia sp.]|nr:ABC transporter permease [Wolbachia sp.]